MSQLLASATKEKLRQMVQPLSDVILCHVLETECCVILCKFMHDEFYVTISFQKINFVKRGFAYKENGFTYWHN
jgi:hypothetical protein